MNTGDSLQSILDDTLGTLARVRGETPAGPWCEEYGVVTSVGQGIARVRGLPNVKSEELVRFANGLLGMTLNLDPGDIGVILLDDDSTLESGSEVRRTNRVLDTLVGEPLLGRVVDPLGRIVDSLPLGAEGVIDAQLPRPIGAPIYARVGDAPIVLIAAMALFVVIRRRLHTNLVKI